VQHHLQQFFRAAANLPPTLPRRHLVLLPTSKTLVIYNLSSGFQIDRQFFDLRHRLVQKPSSRALGILATPPWRAPTHHHLRTRRLTASSPVNTKLQVFGIMSHFLVKHSPMLRERLKAADEHSHDSSVVQTSCVAEAGQSVAAGCMLLPQL
jgi:hypothetical protein